MEATAGAGRKRDTPAAVAPRSYDPAVAALTDELREFLVATPFFAGLWDRGLDQLAAMLEERSFAPRATVIREGEAGASMFIVCKGQLLTLRRASSGRQVKLMRLGPGDFFGEMALIEMQPRAATIVVDQEPATIYELAGSALYRLYKTDVKAYVMILQNINRELCRRLRAASDRIASFAEIDPQQVPRPLLIVDDSAAVRGVARKELAGLGLEILEAEDGLQALEVCRARRPALVVADVNMPGMDGINLLRELRADLDPRLCALPVVLLTGDRSPETRAQAWAAGASAVLDKPAPGAALVAAVRENLR